MKKLEIIQKKRELDILNGRIIGAGYCRSCGGISLDRYVEKILRKYIFSPFLNKCVVKCQEIHFDHDKVMYFVDHVKDKLKEFNFFIYVKEHNDRYCRTIIFDKNEKTISDFKNEISEIFEIETNQISELYKLDNDDNKIEIKEIKKLNYGDIIILKINYFKKYI